MSAARRDGKPLPRGADRPRSEAPEPGEIYIEFRQVGAQLRADAVDAATGVEVTVFGPTNVSHDELGRLAVRKLIRRLNSVSHSPGPPHSNGRNRFA